VEKSGSWYSFNGERIGQGRENSKQFLKEHVDMTAKLDTDLRAKLGLPPLVVAEKMAAKGKGSAS